MEGDATRLEQVVSNLLNNATKYTEPGGRIALALTREDRDAVLRVQDSGVGITPEMQQRIFDLFVQADQSLDRARGGLGIGLTLVRRLVEFHDGTISVFSAGPGQGSEFLVRLPLAELSSNMGHPGPAPNAMAGRNLRILVVDDNKDQRPNNGKNPRARWTSRLMCL